VFEGPLRLAAILVSLVIVVSFGLFVVDESGDASQRAVAGVSLNHHDEKLREHAHGRVRELIDDADDQLLSPFSGIASGSSSAWVRRGVPALIGLLVYGLGGGYLARFARGRP
jgi:hypothetical protein